MRRFILVSLSLYGVGVGLSQSLMSLGGTLFVVIFLWGLYGLFVDKDAPFKSLTPAEKIAFTTGVLFVAISLAHLIWVKDRQVAWDGLKNLPLFLVPLCALLPRITKTLHFEDLRWPLRITAASFAVSVAWAAWQVVVQNHGVATAAMGNPIYYAYNLLPALSFFMFLAWRSSLLWLVLGTWVLIAQGMSASRVATLTGLVIWVLFLFLLCLKQKRLWIFSLALALVAATGYWTYQNHKIFRSKFRTIVMMRVHRDSSWTVRKRLWDYNMNIWLENPLWGVGYKQNYADAAQRTRFAGRLRPGFHHYAHSVYIQSLAESGAVGSVLHLTSFVALGVALPATIPVLGTTALGGVTENIFHNSKALHSFLFFALLSGLWAKLRPKEDLS